MINTTFVGNVAAEGGALNLAGTTLLVNCSFEENVSDEEEGSVISNIGYISGISNCSFLRNAYSFEPNTFLDYRGVQRLRRAGIRRFRPRGGHQNSPFRGSGYMIPYMVGKLAPSSSHLTRGFVKHVPGRAISVPLTPKTRNKLLHPRPFPIVGRLYNSVSLSLRQLMLIFGPL